MFYILFRFYSLFKGTRRFGQAGDNRPKRHKTCRLGPRCVFFFFVFFTNWTQTRWLGKQQWYLGGLGWLERQWWCLGAWVQWIVTSNSSSNNLNYIVLFIALWCQLSAFVQVAFLPWNIIFMRFNFPFECFAMFNSYLALFEFILLPSFSSFWCHFHPIFKKK